MPDSTVPRGVEGCQPETRAPFVACAASPAWHSNGKSPPRIRIPWAAALGALVSGSARRCFATSAGWAILATAVLGSALIAEDAQIRTGAQPLLDPDVFPAGWVHFTAGEDSDISDTWRLERDGDAHVVLACSGQPYGYLCTTETYDNFEFGLEWKYPTDENGNSGILVYTTGEDKIWPTSIQIQLHSPSAGSILPTGGASPKTPVPVKDLARSVNQWNSCVIASRDGRISVSINGKPAGGIVDCAPRRGRIALQSEGSEVHFRNVWIRKLGTNPAQTPEP